MSDANDTFTEASDLILASHTADTGESWTHTTDGQPGPNSDLEIDSANDYVTAQKSGGSVGHIFELNFTPSSNEYDVEADILIVGNPSTSKPVALLGRLTSGTSFYGFVAYPAAADPDVRIVKRVGATITSLQSGNNGEAFSSAQTCKFQIRSADKKAFIAGVEVLSEPTDDITGTGQGGFGCGDEIDTGGGVSTAWKIDNFAITNAAAAAASTFHGGFSMMGCGIG